MMGFYLILDQHRSVREIAERLGALTPCAVYYFPDLGLPHGEPAEVTADGKAELETVLIALPGYVEEDVRQELREAFGDELVKVYLLTYREPAFFRRVSSALFEDDHVWVLDDDGIQAGRAFLKKLETAASSDCGGGGAAGVGGG